MRTTLYEKMFLDGFEKPSYVVATLALERPLPDEELAQAVRATLERHPRLRSTVTFRFGVPIAFAPQPADVWPGPHHLDRADLDALEERLLGTPLDPRVAFPFEVYTVRRPAALVVKVHHAVIDASSGFAVLQDFTRLLEGRVPAARARRRELGRVRVAARWASRATLAPRLPGIGVTARYRPETPLVHTPVVHRERVLHERHALLTRRARARGATFFELVASALLSAMHAYNARAPGSPERVGLMFARARPRALASGASFRAETRAVSVASSQLVTPHHPSTLGELRRAANDPRHDDLALAALYVARKLRRSSTQPREHRGLVFTLSDLTSFGRRMAHRSPDAPLPFRNVRVLASPTAFDHAGMLVSRRDDDVRLSLVTHRGAIDADALLDATVARLEEA